MVVANEGRHNVYVSVLAVACHNRNQELAYCTITNSNPPANESDNTVIIIMLRNVWVLCIACPTGTAARYEFNRKKKLQSPFTRCSVQYVCQIYTCTAPTYTIVTEITGCGVATAS